jgi:hypothetical protein
MPSVKPKFNTITVSTVNAAENIFIKHHLKVWNVTSCSTSETVVFKLS